jgi:hypothetical protein
VDASVSVKTAETAEMDDEQHFGATWAALLLSPQAEAGDVSPVVREGDDE